MLTNLLLRLFLLTAQGYLEQKNVLLEIFIFWYRHFFQLWFFFSKIQSSTGASLDPPPHVPMGIPNFMANLKYHTKIYVKEICRLILCFLMTSFHSNSDLLLTSCLIIVGTKRIGQCHYVCIDIVIVKIKQIPKIAFLKQKFRASENFDE